MSFTSATTTATCPGRVEDEGHGEQTPNAPGDGNSRGPTASSGSPAAITRAARLTTLRLSGSELSLPLPNTRQVWCLVVVVTDNRTAA